jgi:aryl-alcohol dehydrogenase-like predicted oxidoreductase
MGLDRRPLGSTPFDVTVMGYGSGGFSRAGLDQGFDHAAGVIAAVVESGVNFIDTAANYGTEAAVAAGIARADVDPTSVTVATKYLPGNRERLLTPDEVRTTVVERLAALGRERLDLLQIHSVLPDRYEIVRDTHLPVLEELRADGLITAIGITEMFQFDTGHQTLAKALADRCWDTVMVGYNLLNTSGGSRVIQPAASAGAGVIVMFAVREALVDFDRLRTHLTTVDHLSPAEIEDRLARLATLVEEEGGTLIDLAYRFASSTAGTSTILVGTGNPAHLADNRATFELEPLNPQRVAEIGAVFGDLDVLSGQTSRSRPRPG